MIPEYKASNMAITIYDAFQAAEDGNVVAGYRLLDQGWHAARMEPAPWRAEAAALWLRALTCFRQRFPREWYLPLEAEIETAPRERSGSPGEQAAPRRSDTVEAERNECRPDGRSDVSELCAAR